MRDDVITGGVEEPTLDQKVAFLSRSSAYGPSVTGALSRETHMSWVFLAGDRVYKLKKPVRFPYLDFSTLRRREAACRAEFDSIVGWRRTSISTSYPSPQRRTDSSIGGRCKSRRLARGHAAPRRGRDARARHLWRIVSHRGSSIGSSPRLYSSIAGQTPVFLSPAVHLRDWLQKLGGQSARAARPAPRAAFGAHPPHCQFSDQVPFRAAADAGQARLRAWHRRWARRPAPRAYLAGRSGEDHRLPRVQPALAGRRSIR